MAAALWAGGMARQPAREAGFSSSAGGVLPGLLWPGRGEDSGKAELLLRATGRHPRAQGTTRT